MTDHSPCPAWEQNLVFLVFPISFLFQPHSSPCPPQIVHCHYCFIHEPPEAQVKVACRVLWPVDRPSLTCREVTRNSYGELVLLLIAKHKLM